MRKYRVITIANRRPYEPYYTYDEFFQSLGGDDPLILGSNPGEYGGLGSKPRLLYNAIMTGKVPEKYIIFSDCFDVVFAVRPRQLLDRYRYFFNAPFVISAEKNCFPGDLKEQYDQLNSTILPYKYLNSGMIVAETEAMLSVLESMGAKDIPNDYWDGEKMVNPNDQLYYQSQFLKQPVNMVMDYEQILCNTLHDVPLEEFKFEGGRGIKNLVTGRHPASFHFNGGAKTGPCREPILKHLGY